MVQNFENYPAAPHVYVYCAGLLQEDIPPPAWPPAFSVPGAIGFGVMWRVADVRPQVGADGLTTGCEVERLRQPGTDADFVTVNDPSF